jgi:hypothetical protein
VIPTILSEMSMAFSGKTEGYWLICAMKERPKSIKMHYMPLDITLVFLPI